MEVSFVSKLRKLFDELGKDSEPVAVSIPAAALTHDLLQDGECVGLLFDTPKEQGHESQFLVPDGQL